MKMIMETSVAQFQTCLMQARIYGVNDCCIRVADALVPVWKKDLMAGLRGRYKTAIGFARLMKKMGFADLLEAVDAMAIRAGAVRLEDDPHPQDFDLGFVVVARPGDINNIDSVPAFFWMGYWRAMTRDGYALVPTVSRSWRLALVGEVA